MLFDYLISDIEKTYFSDISRQMHMRIVLFITTMELGFLAACALLAPYLSMWFLIIGPSGTLLHGFFVKRHVKSMLKSRFWKYTGSNPDPTLNPSQRQILKTFSMHAIVPYLLALWFFAELSLSNQLSLSELHLLFIVLTVLIVPTLSAFAGIHIATSILFMLAITALYGYPRDFAYSQQDIAVSIIFIVFLSAILYLQSQSFLHALKLKYSNQKTSRELSLNSVALQHAHRLQTQYLNAASLELRQPLQTLALIAEDLRWNNPDPKIEPSVQKIAQSVDSLIQSFDTMLNLSRLDAEGIGVQNAHCSLNGIFERLLMDFQHTAHDKHLQLRTQNSKIWLFTDEGVLYSILSNFVSNALRYTETGHVVIGIKRRPEGQIDIQVIDTGVGINPSDIERIFDEYERLDYAQQRAIGGVGLGLSIAKRMANVINAQVVVRSTQGRGSVFALRCPAHMVRTPPMDQLTRTDSPPQPTLSTLQGRSIALCEDKTEYLFELKKLLELWGCLVTIVRDYEDLYQQMQAGAPFEIVISEQNLGALHESGIHILTKTHHAIEHTDCRIHTLILLTANTSPKLSQAAQICDIHVIYKPIQPKTLYARLHQILVHKI